MRAPKFFFAAMAFFLALLPCCKGKQEELQKTVNVSEVKFNLASVYAAQVAYHARKNAYADSFSTLAWKPEAGHKFAYFLPAEAIQPDKGGPFQPFGGLVPKVTAEEFTIIAVGNIDDDPTLDIWQVDQTNEIRHVVDDLKY